MNKRAHLPQTIIFLGASGSGKDTQADFLRKQWGHGGKEISTGDVLRAMARHQNRVGRFVKKVLDHGGLMPVWGPMYVWLTEFVEHLSGEEHIVFTGAPRRVEEAAIMDAFMKDLGRARPMAVYLEVPDAVIKKRLAGRGRYDDNARAISGRIAFFKKYVSRVVAYYRLRGRLIRVNGNQPPPAVWREVKSKLKIR